jgi:hypothetical protein
LQEAAVLFYTDSNYVDALYIGCIWEGILLWKTLKFQALEG